MVGAFVVDWLTASSTTSTATDVTGWGLTSDTTGSDWTVTYGGRSYTIPMANTPKVRVRPKPIQPPPEPVRLPPPREFNKFINASDLAEDFIRWLGTQGVRKDEVLGLPFELFIKWLIVRACEADGEEPNVTVELPTRAGQPRCSGCQRFIARQSPVPFHNPRCAEFYFARQQRAA